jgi:hypothetical protein
MQQGSLNPTIDKLKFVGHWSPPRPEHESNIQSASAG